MVTHEEDIAREARRVVTVRDGRIQDDRQVVRESETAQAR
jgi:hypothetical protein